MLITYLKKTGELVSPIMTSEEPLTLADAIGEEKAEIYGLIYDVINIVDNVDIFNNFKNYYVDTKTKELKNKEVLSIQYLD